MPNLSLLVPNERNLAVLRFSFLLICFHACVAPYDFEVISEPNALVIDASLTNEEKAHLVKLSFAENLDSTSFRSVSGASVSFIHAGERIRLIETEGGIYRTDSSYFGLPGQSYQLEVILTDGQRFLSEEVTMPQPVEIDSVYGRYIIVPNDRNERFQNGVQVFLDARSNDQGHHNFRYEFQESYAVDVPFPSRYDFRGSGPTFEIIERDRPLDRCYRKRQQSRTIIATTRNQTENSILELPVRFINESLPDLAYDYRLGVRQYTITDEAYQYFRQLRDINESSGSLSDRQLGILQGNISSVGETDMTVLGYFEVAGASEVRRTFNYKEFEEDGIRTEEWVCTGMAGSGCVFNSEAAVQVLFSVDTFRVERGDTVYLTEFFYDFTDLGSLLNVPACLGEWRITDIPEVGEYAFYAHKRCSDCREWGLFERPEVWDELSD
ncbi:MAG: DUF4249 domain-containing protein [Cytophagales bacterium]|nr:DUF4249 domain-containing protein [Cytophagales bacterium]